ncbi:MAG: 3-methyl-2-oxobutanoate hydroxymethyltransferase [Gammaproteobacteria bacterium]
MSSQTKQTRLSVSALARMKKESEKIACLTAYDAAFARLEDEAGVDIILVGDSVGMVVQGHDTTVPVTMDDMVYHTRLVARGCRRAFLMADLPFMSFTNVDQALDNSARLMQEAGAQMVKLEAGADQLEIMERLSMHGVPICAHLGLQPQSIHKLGGYKVQGRDEKSASALLKESHVLEESGADILLLECVPARLAEEITANSGIPVIGIGAGQHCDGQILVLYDILDIAPGKRTRFSKDFLDGQSSIQGAVKSFVEEVKEKTFPDESHSF